MDEQIERLFNEVEAMNPGRRTLWVVTADHGEGLGAHDFFGHGMYIYEEQVRVPMIFYGGDSWRNGETVGQMVRHVDLKPTLAELLGVEIDSEALTLEGRSLVPLLRNPESPLRIDVAISHRRPADEARREDGWEPGLVISARTDRYKYILKTRGDDELYDLEADPFETRNLIGEGLRSSSNSRPGSLASTSG